MQILLSRCFLFLLSFLFSLFGLTEKMEKPADFRLIITGGIMGVHGGDDAFYDSPLFRLSDVVDAEFGPFVIENASFMSFRYNDVLYFSFEKIEKNTLMQNVETPKILKQKGTVQGLLGAQAMGFAFDQVGMIDQLNDNALRRELGSVYGQFNWELHQIGNVCVFAVDISGKNNVITWPKQLAEINDVEAVIGLYPKVKKRTVFFPRSLAPTSRVFGVVDRLLAQRSQIPTRYLDLGNALLSSADESLAAAKQTHALLMARNPIVLGASRYDLSALLQEPALLEKSPYILSLRGLSGAQQSRIEKMGNIKIQFSALGDIDKLARGFFPRGVSSLTVSESIQKSGASAGQADLVIGLSDNSNTAGLAISSPVFDAVLSLVSDVKGALPAQDNIDLQKNHQEGLHSVAPLVRVSALDVTEILVWANKNGYIDRLEIKRYPAVDSGPEAKDAEEIFNFNQSLLAIEPQGLPIKQIKGVTQAWIQSDFDNILGGILLKAQPDTELAIIEQTLSATPIYSAIGYKQAQNLLDRPGRAVWLSLKGKQIKRVLKASKQNQFGLPIVLIGGDYNKYTIGQREIEDNELYRVVVTEKVLFALDRFVQREGLFAKSILAASSLQTSLFEGSRDSLKILSELRKREDGNDASIGEKWDLLGASLTISEIVQAALVAGASPKEEDVLRGNPLGKRRRTLIFDVSDLDFGLKFNHTNDVLLGWQDYAKTSGTSFTESRFWDPNYLNMLIYTKAALRYYGPWIDTELSFSEKFFRANSLSGGEESELNDTLAKNAWEKVDEIKFKKIADKLRPVKDTTKITGEIRLPFNKLASHPILPALGLGVFASVIYETQIWPNVWMNPVPPQYWPQRVNDGRFMLGLSGRPQAVIDMFQISGVFGYDFSRSSPMQSLAAGLEIGGSGKWNIGALIFKLESSVRKMFPFDGPEKGRMGLFWLTDSKLEVPIYGGFSLSALLNFTVGAQMDNPWDLGSNTLFGLALSYGGNFKWLL
jgi:hypothetical protein